MLFDDNIIKQIGLPESDQLKYEALLPSSSELGRLISAFSNTNGGRLILGILNKNGAIKITGLSADFQVDVVLTNALSKVSPASSVRSGFITYQGKQLFVLDVSKVDTQISYNNIAYGIKSKKVQKLSNMAQTNSSKSTVMNTEQFLDEILTYLIANPGLKNVNKHTVREVILNKKVSIEEAAQFIEKLRNSGNVQAYGDRFIGYSIDTKSFINGGGYSKKSAAVSSHLISKTVFISYNWNHKLPASKLYDFLKTNGYIPTMDDHHLTYKDKISTFMESIRVADYAVMIISDEYLKSENCMTEVLHVLKDHNSHHKILPIRHNDVKIFKTADRIYYVDYWKNKVEELSTMLKDIDPTDAIEEFKKLKMAKRIHSEMNDFLSEVADMITSTIEEEEKDSYKNIVDFIEGNQK